MTDDEVYTWFNEHQHPNFAGVTFQFLDSGTAKNKTCRIRNTNINAMHDNKITTTGFYASIHISIPLEAATISWFEQVELEPSKAYTRKHIEEEKRMAAKRAGQGI